MPGLPVGSCGFRCGMRHRAVQPLRDKAMCSRTGAGCRGADLIPGKHYDKLTANYVAFVRLASIRLGLRVARWLMWYNDQGE